MNESLSTISAIVGIVSGFLSVIGFAVVLFQIHLAKKSMHESTRARLQLSLETLEEKNKKYVILVITNTGVLPARDVQLQFDEGIKFHSMRGSDHYLFLAPNKITELQHRESIAFRLGATTGDANMNHVFSSNLTGHVTYLAGTSKLLARERFSVTLNQSGFIVYRKGVTTSI